MTRERIFDNFFGSTLLIIPMASMNLNSIWVTFCRMEQNYITITYCCVCGKTPDADFSAMIESKFQSSGVIVELWFGCRRRFDWVRHLNSNSWDSWIWIQPRSSYSACYLFISLTLIQLYWTYLTLTFISTHFIMIWHQQSNQSHLIMEAVSVWTSIWTI